MIQKQPDPVGKCRLGWEAYRKRLEKEDKEGIRILNAFASKLETTLTEKGFRVRRL